MITLQENANKVLVSKAKEYSFHSRFDNFYTAATLTRQTPQVVLNGFLLKHLVSVLDIVNGNLIPTPDLLIEKFGDAYNYCILGLAMTQENEDVLHFNGESFLDSNTLNDLRAIEEFCQEMNIWHNKERWTEMYANLKSAIERLYASETKTGY